MRLTDVHREAFVNAALLDVPRGGFDEQAAALIKQTVLNHRLPAVANVVTDFMRAGWPKGQAKPAAKPAAKRGAGREKAVQA